MPEPTTSKNSHSPMYIASLAAAAAVILVVGFLLKPRKPQVESSPPLSQIETQRLARMAQRQALDTMTDHFSEVAGDLRARVVQVGAGTGSGILWGASLVLTAATGTHVPESTVVMTPTGHLLAATRTVAGPDLPLAAFELVGETPRGSEPFEQAKPLQRAEWVLAVWHQEGDLAFSPGHYVEVRPRTCGELAVEEVLTGLAFSGEMAGGGLFDLDGALVAVLLPCGDDVVALTPGSVSRLLEMGRSFEERLLDSYGMRTIEVDDAAREHLGVEAGALVSEVWTGHRADRSGLRPGDVIVRVGEQEVGAPPDLQPLLLPAELGGRQVAVRRGRRTLDVDLSPTAGAPSDNEEVAHGVELEPTPSGFTIGAVASGSGGAEAGLQAGDRIVRVGGVQPRNEGELRRALERRPVFVEIERGQRRLGKLLQ